MRRGAHAGLKLAGALLGLACILSCAAGEVEAPPYDFGRDDYFAFRARYPDLQEPNYLPFMAYRLPVRPHHGITGWLDGGLERLRGRRPEERLVFCHWAKSDFPLPVFVQAPKIPERLRSDLRPSPGEGYVEAVKEALAIWQRDLDGEVGFRVVPREEDAVLSVRLVAGPSEKGQGDVEVLGSTPVRRSCQVEGGDPSSGRLRVRFRVREVRVSVADRYGLLLPDQVERLALHEIGHALGMREHSPEPSDLMYAVARDRLPPEGLGLEDVNSFLSFYALPSGTIYTDPDRARPKRGLRPPPQGTPRLDIAPHVDSRLGFEVQVPEGWMRIPTQYGLAVVDGVPWDYEVSLQVNVFRYDTVDEYLARFGRAYVRDSEVVGASRLHVAGRPARRLVLETDHGTREEITFLASGDGRVVVILAECPLEQYAVYHRWFEAMGRTLEIEPESGSGPSHDRDYTPEGPRTP